MAVKNSTKPTIVDIDEASQIQVRTLLTGGLNSGPHVGLEVGETYGLNITVRRVALHHRSASLRLRRASLISSVPGGGRAVSHASGDGWGVAVKNSTKPIIVDIDEASQIQVRTLLTGGLNPGPHVVLEVGETYGLNVP